MLVVNRGCRMPARTLLKFEPVLGDPGSLPAPDTKVWTAADHKHAFTITREGKAPVFVVRVSWLDGSQAPLAPCGAS